MRHAPERGFLVLADISGFTAFLTATAIDHGPPIIAELLEVVIRRLALPLEIQEVEGDAVFALGRDGALAVPADLLGVLDNAFAAFRARREEIAADESCECDACLSTAALDLKIVVHHGPFLRQLVGGWAQVAGRDVVLAHRLLKNGLRCRSPYVLLTGAAAGAMDISPAAAGLVAHTERYDHLGEVPCFVGAPGSLHRARAIDSSVSPGARRLTLSDRVLAAGAG